MNRDERYVEEYLRSLNAGSVVFEPDGNSPPDFLVDGQIAVESRRLNQHRIVDGRARGLEEDSIPIRQSILRMLARFGAGGIDRSWWFSYNFRRPISPWPLIRRAIEARLTEFIAAPPEHEVQLQVEPRFTVTLTPSSERLDQTFMLGACSDIDAGGWIVAEIVKNLETYVPEKTRKTQGYRDKYPTWWLVFVDYIGLARECSDVRKHYSRPHEWNRLILLSPVDGRTCEI
jgi:hypothetical protein